MKAFILLLISSIAFGASAPVGYPTATNIKLFKPGVDFNGQAQILSGTVDPTGTATSAPIGSIYLNSSTGIPYRKLDAGSTVNWLNMSVGAIAQSSYFGGMEQVGVAGGTCVWNENTSSALNNFVTLAGATGCNAWTTDGNVVSGGANVQGPTANNMPVGQYQILVAGSFYESASQNCAYRLTDGTNTYPAQTMYSSGSVAIAGLTFHIPITTPGTRTYSMQAADDGTGYCGMTNNFSGAGLVWKIYYFPTQSQVAYTPPLLPAYAGKQWLGATAANIVVGASQAASNPRTTFSAASLAAYTILGTAQNDASQNFQVTATYPPGEYEVDFINYMRAQTAASGTTTSCVFDLYDGTNVLGSNFVQSSSQAAGSVQDTNHLKGYFKITGTSSVSKTIYVRAAKVAGDTSASSNCQTYVDASVGSTSTAILSISPRTQNVAMPVIMNSVVTSNTGVERFERAVVSYGSSCSATPCTIATQTGGISSVSRTGTGAYSINFTTAFSAQPSCSVGVGGGATQYQVTGITTSSFAFSTLSSTGAASDAANMSIMCGGPK